MQVYLVQYHNTVEDGLRVHFATLDEQKANNYVETHTKAIGRVDAMAALHEAWYYKEDGFSESSEEQINARFIEHGYTQDEVDHWREHGTDGSGWFVQVMELDKQ